MNNPVVEYSWTFRKHLTLLIITYCSKNYITTELEESPMAGSGAT